MKKAAILALAACAAWPVLAAEKPAGGRPGTNVDMPYLMAPLANADGKLTGYAYLAPRLTAADESGAVRVRDRLAFIQDAFVRDVNATPVAMANDSRTVDVAGVEARLLADARQVMGAGRVRLVTICTVQVADLHPVRPALRADAGMTNNPPKAPSISRCGN